MLSDHERRRLQEIELQFQISDPRFAASFRILARARRARPLGGHRKSMHGAGSIPCLLLAAGLAMLVIGATSGAMTLVVAGMVLAVLTLGLAYTRAAPNPGAGFA